MSRISQQEIENVLRMYMGSAALESQPDFAAFLTRKFISWLYVNKSLAQMYADLRQDLMMCIFAASNHTMRLRMDDGRMGVWTEDALDALTDCMLEILFFHLPRTHSTYLALFDYLINFHSHSAIKTLYLYYDEFLEPANRAHLVNIIREQFDPADYQRWLSPSDYQRPET